MLGVWKFVTNVIWDGLRVGLPLEVDCRCMAPWLSWLKRLSSNQEIPSWSLGVVPGFFFLCTHDPKRAVAKSATTRDRTGDL